MHRADRTPHRLLGAQVLQNKGSLPGPLSRGRVLFIWNSLLHGKEERKIIRAR